MSRWPRRRGHGEAVALANDLPFPVFPECFVQNACYMVHSMGEVDPAQRGMNIIALFVEFLAV